MSKDDKCNERRIFAIPLCNKIQPKIFSLATCYSQYIAMTKVCLHAPIQLLKKPNICNVGRDTFCVDIFLSPALFTDICRRCDAKFGFLLMFGLCICRRSKFDWSRPPYAFPTLRYIVHGYPNFAIFTIRS